MKDFDNPNDMWHAWKSIFNLVTDKHAPVRTRRVRAAKAPWVTPQLKQCMHNRDIQKIKAIRSKNPIDWATFKKYRNSVNDDIKKAKQLYYNSAFYENEKNIRKTWNIINELTSRKQRDTRINSEIKLSGVQLVTLLGYLRNLTIILPVLGLSLLLGFRLILTLVILT